ncbi:hypothetical protein PRIPAC_80234, partial [Pristionchus pacificus]
CTLPSLSYFSSSPQSLSSTLVHRLISRAPTEENWTESSRRFPATTSPRLTMTQRESANDFQWTDRLLHTMQLIFIYLDVKYL